MLLLRNPVFVVVVLAVCSCRNALAQQLRPLYIMGHMANTIEEVNAYLLAGANAIEADMAFDSSTSKAAYFYHGLPCDCFRVCHRSSRVHDYLKHLRDLATPGHPNFISSFTGLLLVDMKVSGIPDLKTAGSNLAQILMKTVFVMETRLTLVFEITSADCWKVIDHMIQELMRSGRADILGHIGLSDSGSRYFNHFMSMMKLDKYKFIGGFMLADGSPNCFEHFYNTLDIREAINRRDQDIGISKAIRWTIDYKRNMRNALSMEVDIILSNHVKTVREVMNEPEFSHRYRLATLYDDPFQTYVGAGRGKRHSCSMKGLFKPKAFCWMDVNIGGKWCWTTTPCGDDPSVCHQQLHCR